jgi:hypothetical protein
VISGCATSGNTTTISSDTPPPAASPSPQAGNTQSEARLLAAIDFGDERTKDAITAPETVAAGKDFQIEIKSFGGGCERGGDTGTVVTENSADVMVYDFTSATHPGVACTMIFKTIPHTVTLRFTKTGEALIRVWGRRVGGDNPRMGVPVVLEKRITVK